MGAQVYDNAAKQIGSPALPDVDGDPDTSG
jgi:hypothetical protein